ncbi:putative N-methylhydaintoinase A [Alteracholeplasma palmae J233]|uniref:Putative N-methylhydaintoinase A n=1 Tax=Alteracholeplasma palmae (strain ATCC 49389 / J233) TaxID=1318466 RepID=U4KR92_ALTPJ|nr:hydantoinase/oxoprolinase family protein [Alteracholeplasma palmae]CCV63956.1 putative N-methylhydaintoinase A [Alteracholeplasma palmae J233]
MGRTVRMGIDVGGTHTKAVAIDNETHQVIGKSSVKTTHDHKSGVAAGVVESFMNCLKENKIDPQDVVFVAHSTTQATNALIEGDVAKVGVLGIAKGGIEAFFAKKQTNMHEIDLGSGKKIEIINRFVKTKKALKNPEKFGFEKAVDELKNEGAEVIVASQAFGVDGVNYEKKVAEIAEKVGLFPTMASDITKLYGLTRRTRTAVINGSILPKMLDTANSTEQSVRAANVHVPLMIMRGDGGVMEIAEMKKRPVLTMLSGPAASVMGSLMYLRASNGVYFEVGGTTTNIGVIKNGRPAIDYSQVGKHRTYISSLDVKILGCAGGSMVRANKEGVIDVGPRSAHIAGLDYSVYTKPSEIVNPKVEFFSPKPGDPSDYVAVRLENGKRVTITNSCAANVLGLVTKEHFSYGEVESARKAIGALAEYCNTTVEDIATQIMERAYAKIEPVILGLAEKYKLEKDQITLVGVGGGAASLIIYFANKMGLNYSIPENAEVISSIGVALAMVRDVVERVIPSPSKEEIKAIKLEAMNKAIESGATPDSVEVHIDIDPQTSKVTAIATGSTEVKTSSTMKELSEKEALELAAKDLRTTEKEVKLETKTKYFYVFEKDNKSGRALRIIDKKGFIRVQRGNGISVKTTVENYLEVVKDLWEKMASYQAEVILRPDYYVCAGPRLMDFSSIHFEQLALLMDTQLSDLDENEEVIIIAANAEV